MYWKRFHVVEHASTLVYCCFLWCSVISAAILLAKNIVPFLVITCKAHEVYMLLQTSTHEILSAIDVLKEISCGWTCFNTGLLLFFDKVSNTCCCITGEKYCIIFSNNMQSTWGFHVITGINPWNSFSYRCAERDFMWLNMLQHWFIVVFWYGQ